jgi:hypothetical protein
MSFSVSLSKIQEQYNFNIDSVSIFLHGPTNARGKLIIEDTIASGTFANLTQGSYTITVYMFSGIDTIASGTGTATVLPGQQTTANITISFLPGRLTINVSLPPGNSTLLAYYPFNGNAADASGNGLNGTVYGATLTSDRFGSINSAYSFDVASNYISTPNLFSAPPSSFSISMFIKPTAYSTSDSQNMIYFSGHGGEFELLINETSLEFYVLLSSGIWYQVSYPITISAWHHIAATYARGDKIELFIDGSFVGSTALPNLDLFNPGSNFQGSIGCYNRSRYFFKGSIDDIRIFNYVLSSTAVQYYYIGNGW